MQVGGGGSLDFSVQIGGADVLSSGRSHSRTFPDLNRAPVIPDHEPLRLIGRGSYGEVWLARNVLGTLRAVKVVHRADFSSPRPFEREFHGIQRFEPVSRSHSGLVHVLQVGRNDADGYFYYVMELADAVDTTATDPDAYAPRTLAAVIPHRTHSQRTQMDSRFATRLYVDVAWPRPVPWRGWPPSCPISRERCHRGT